MIKALKSVLILAALAALFWGAAMLIVPNKVASWNSFPELTEGMKYFIGLLGAMYVALAVGFVLASRDPVKHRTWVQFGLVSYGLSLISTLYYLLSNAINFGQARAGLIIQIVFLVALALLYPKKQAN